MALTIEQFRKGLRFQTHRRDGEDFIRLAVTWAIHADKGVSLTKWKALGEEGKRHCVTELIKETVGDLNNFLVAYHDSGRRGKLLAKLTPKLTEEELVEFAELLFPKLNVDKLMQVGTESIININKLLDENTK